MTVTMQENMVTLADGRRVALLENEQPAPGQQGKPLLIALHGWLDNGASFLPLAPYLADFHLVCVDLPGHGHSDHKRVRRGVPGARTDRHGRSPAARSRFCRSARN